MTLAMERGRAWAALGVTVLCTMLPGACTRSNNLLLGRVEADVGGHRVVVTDCYRTRVPRPEASPGGATGDVAYRWTPCRDADVRISGALLDVNGRSYGRLAAGVPVTVDHGVVRVGTLD